MAPHGSPKDRPGGKLGSAPLETATSYLWGRKARGGERINGCILSSLKRRDLSRNFLRQEVYCSTHRLLYPGPSAGPRTPE